MIEIDGTQAYVSIIDGMLHANIRATDRETFRAQAQAVGLMVEQQDDEGNTVLRVHRNVDLTEEQPDLADPRSAPMPRIVLDPGEMDGDGNYTVQPTFDSRYHANFRLNRYATEAGAWHSWAKAWTLSGTQATPNAAEQSMELQGIELIDPDSISSPSNRWV